MAEKKKEDPKPKAAEAKTEETPKPMEATDRQVQTMSEAQKTLYNLGRTAQEPRKVESVEDLEPAILMQIPEEFWKNYPERSYKWGAASRLTEEIAESRGLWAPVTRSTHSRIPEHHYDLATGLVLYGGPTGNALLYTYRSAVEMQKKKVLQDFDLTFRRLEHEQNRPLKNHRGKEIGSIERADQMGIGREPVEMNHPDFKYDYESPRDGV